MFLIGVDLLRDVPDAALVRRALDNVPVKVVQSLELGSLERFADAFLPASAFLEKDGHVSTWEGRGQRLQAIRDATGSAWRIGRSSSSMALACGGDLGFETLDEIHEMGRLLGARAAGSVRDEEVGARRGPARRLGRGPRRPARLRRARGDEGHGGSLAQARRDATAGTAEGDDRLVLFTYPLLVDEGRLSDHADELKARSRTRRSWSCTRLRRRDRRRRRCPGDRAHRAGEAELAWS